MNFYDIASWRAILLIAVLFSSLLLANILKKKLFKNSLVPNSVLGGCILLTISTICYYATGNYLFDLSVFDANGCGIDVLEQLTYHCLAIGFIAMTLRPSLKGVEPKRGSAVINSGVLTVSGYLVQAVLGIVCTLIGVKVLGNLAPGSGMLLCFGYGQGTGQALNIGKNLDATTGETGVYADIGLTIAAMGFLVASICGVIFFNILRKKGKLFQKENQGIKITMSEIEGEDEEPSNEFVDKLSIQGGLVIFCYIIAYGMMSLLGALLPSMKGTIFGFNFLFGTLAAVIVKAVLNFLKKKGLMHHEYANIYLMNRISGFAFDLMIVSGICAIRIGLLEDYIGLVLIIGIVGAIATYLYVRSVCRNIFPKYEYEQFFAWFGMLTGTASTGMMLLREIDPKLETPVSDNMVYQNFPAIIMGFPMLFLANWISNNPSSEGIAIKVAIICALYFIALNVFLFREKIFKKKK